jgi:hypothetical protein
MISVIFVKNLTSGAVRADYNPPEKKRAPADPANTSSPKFKTKAATNQKGVASTSYHSKGCTTCR